MTEGNEYNIELEPILEGSVRSKSFITCIFYARTLSINEGAM
jgi:hypothetical protein